MAKVIQKAYTLYQEESDIVAREAYRFEGNQSMTVRWIIRQWAKREAATDNVPTSEVTDCVLRDENGR